jgi:hypothetical protein
MYGIACMLGSQALLAQTTELGRFLSEPGSIYNGRAMGMGNAYSTIGYDYTATMFNPATLAVADSLTFTMAVNYNAFPNTAEFQTTTTPFTTSNTSLSQAGLTIPLSSETRRVVMALGFTQSKEFNRNLRFGGYNSTSSTLIQDLTTGRGSALTSRLGLSYPIVDSISGAPVGFQTILNSNLQQGGYVVQEGSLLHFSGGIAAEMVTNVFFGASVNYALGYLIRDAEFTETDTNDVYGASTETIPGDPQTADFRRFYVHQVDDVTFSGLDLRVGLLYKFYDFISIGGSFKIPAPQKISIARVQEGYSEFAAGLHSASVPQGDTSFTITPAYEITVGAAVNLWILTGTAEATLIDYTQMRFTGGTSISDAGLLNKQVLEEYSRVINVNAGAEFRVPWTGISARAGFMYRPSPYKNDTQEYDRKYLTAGAGINSADVLSFDVAYQYGWWKELYRGSGQTFAGVVQNVQVHNIQATIKVTLP